jgi:hypothetical protein
MPSDATNERTRRKWRELGFFCNRDDEKKVWRLVGSRSGLLRFRDLLLDYANDPSNDYKSEHEHYGGLNLALTITRFMALWQI